MILWSQQLEIINDSFFSFQAGKKIHVPVSENTRKLGPALLRASIHESMHISNFKILVLDILYNKQPLNIVNLMEILNKKETVNIDSSRRLAKDLKTYSFIIKKDKVALSSLVESNEVIWNEYLKDNIHKFSLHRLFKNNHFKPINRDSKREIEVLNSLMSNFNIEYKDK